MKKNEKEKLPTEIIIFSKRYKIIYCKNPSEVDNENRKSLWGQFDPWTRTIRIYRADSFSFGDVIQTLIHEILHAIINELGLEFDDDEEEEKIVDGLSLGIIDVFTRNKFDFSKLGKENGASKKKPSNKKKTG